MDNSPLTENELDWDNPEVVWEIVMFRVMYGDDDWAEDPASLQWDLTREEAARRLDEGDFSSPLPF